MFRLLFRVQTRPLEKQIKETVHKAFWDMLKQDFEKDPVEYEHSFIILNEAKQVIRAYTFIQYIFFQQNS